MAEVICLGEMLIDFVATESGVTLLEAPAFKKAPGGAPANVAVGVARLGLSSAFMGKVGDDDFGKFLARTLQDNGVDTSALRMSKEARTGLAFVSLRADGERDFLFFRHPSADMLYQSDEVDTAAIQKASIFHFGSITLIDDPSRKATLHAVKIAQDSGLLISYDPNLRLKLWPSTAAARAGLLLGWPHAHVAKVSHEELLFMAESNHTGDAVNKLWHENLKLLLVTEGANGCSYFTKDYRGQVAGFAVDTIDTTGAGDGFVAGLLVKLANNASLIDDEAHLVAALRYANAVGALTTIQRGAIPALPTPDAVATLLGVHS